MIRVDRRFIWIAIVSMLALMTVSPAQAPYHLAPADFTVAVSPSTQSVAPGKSTTLSVKVDPTGGYQGTVSLSSSVSPSTTSITTSLNPTSVSVGVDVYGQPLGGASTLTTNVASSAQVGAYTVTVTGMSGSLSHQTTATLQVTTGPAINLAPTLTSAAPGAKMSFTWEITGSGSIIHTAVHWGTAPGTPTDFRSYPNATPDFASISPPDQAPKTYTVSFNAPSQPGTIYYVVHAIVSGQDVYIAGGERTITISTLPTIALKSAPTSALPSGRLTFTWDVTGSGSIIHTAVHWGTAPGTPTDFRSYPNATPDFASISPPDQAPKTYTASFDAPNQPGTIYYVVHAIVNDQNVYITGAERTIIVASAPTIVLKSAPTSASAGEKLTFSWDVTGTGSVAHTAVHWDTKPGTPTDFRSYSNATPDFASIDPPHQAPRTYTVTFDAPQSGTIYYVIHAIVDGQNVYISGGERSLAIGAVTTTTTGPGGGLVVDPLLIGGVAAAVVVVAVVAIILRKR